MEESTEAVVNEVSVKKTRKPVSAETREKIRLAHLGKKFTPGQLAARAARKAAKKANAAEAVNSTVVVAPEFVEPQVVVAPQELEETMAEQLDSQLETPDATQ
jgi:hypothetical protein